jgi:hypothetical protein
MNISALTHDKFQKGDMTGLKENLLFLSRIGPY